MKRIAFIVATKDRPNEIRRLLKNIEKQSVQPYEIIVVDSGEIRVENILQEFPGLRSRYLYVVPPSAARQRNEGLKALSESVDLVGFLDDDIVFAENALENMCAFWDEAPPEVGGAGFNLINHPQLFGRAFKCHPLAEFLGLYSRRKGVVLPSGFQTMIGTVEINEEMEWLPSGAVVWRNILFNKYRFDEWFEGYSYLEDLDFSFSIRRKYRLLVVATAGYFHYPGDRGKRGGGILSGRREALNRIYFVRKHTELSLIKCRTALCALFFLNAILSFKGNPNYLLRALGNLLGITESLMLLE